MHALGKLSRVEAKLFLREPVGAFFAIFFPAILMLVLGSAIPAFTEPNDDIGGQRPIDLYLPITLALAIATVTMVTLLGALSTYREKGILRRLATTPVAPSTLLTAQFVVNTVALIVGCALAYLAAKIAFDVLLPANLLAAIVSFLLGTAAMAAVALFVTAVTRNARSSSGIGSLIYFPMMFAAGVWTPGPLMPSVVQRVADYTPLGAASQAMQAAWAGDWPRPLHLIVMVAFAAALATAATKLFRWE